MVGNKKFNSGGKKKWVCKHGCKNDKTACKHLEDLITPKRSTPLFESVNKLVGSLVDRSSGVVKIDQVRRSDVTLPPPADRAKEKAQFIARVSDGLSPVEVEVLTLRYVFDEEFGNIAKELKLLGAETAHRVHKEALAKLKMRFK